MYAFDGQSLHVKIEKSHDGGEMVSHVSFSPGGETFLTSGWDKTIRSWDVKTGEQVWKATAPKYAHCFEASVFSPDGETIYSVTRDETIEVRDAETGKLQKSFRWLDQVRGLAINSDGSMLATAGHRGEIKLWRKRDE